MVQNQVPERSPDADGDVATRIAKRSLSKREESYSSEVRRLLDAGLAVMQQSGDGRARVADIVAEAGLSNDAFYRHFPSKDALVTAIIEDGALRLRSYLEHQMAKATTPEDEVRHWVEGVLAQASDSRIADATRAVLRNAGGPGDSGVTGHPAMNDPIAELLRAPLRALGSAAPDLDASLIAFAVIGVMSDHLHRGARPKRSEIDHVADFCVAAAKGSAS